MRLLILFLVLITCKTSPAQESKLLDIKYLVTKRHDSIHVNWQATYDLQLLGKTSNYFKNTTVNNQINNKKNAVSFTPKNSLENEDFLFKDYQKKEMYSKDLIGFRFKTIKDSINNFHWSIKSDTTKIAGYVCRLAESNFRGRTYKAWFTSELPAGGPWKLDGLPGLILKADTKDGYFSVEAINLEISSKDSTFEIINPFLSEEKTYSWQEFKKLYKEKAINTSKFSPGTSTSAITSPLIRLERYIDFDDPDYNEKKILNSINRN
jgi:GLPGLI family protein